MISDLSGTWLAIFHQNFGFFLSLNCPWPWLLNPPLFSQPLAHSVSLLTLLLCQGASLLPSPLWHTCVLGTLLPSRMAGKPAVFFFSSVFLNTYFHFFFFFACCFYVVHIFLFVDEEYSMRNFFLVGCLVLRALWMIKFSQISSSNPKRPHTM